MDMRQSRDYLLDLLLILAVTVALGALAFVLMRP